MTGKDQSGRVLFTNGNVYLTGRGTAPASVLVENGRILAVGSRSELVERTGSRLDEINLAGGLLSPSFIDGHLHPIMGGAERLRCDLESANDADEAFGIIGSYARDNPDVSWITGGGWGLNLFPTGRPDRHQLDRIVSDRPVMLHSADRHIVWVNTRALELAGITASTPDPTDGRFERDADGSPTGLLHEGAFKIVNAVAPESTLNDSLRALEVAQNLMFSLGITGWQDALVRAPAEGIDMVDVYLEADRSSLLKSKVTAALWWDRTRGIEQLGDLIARRSAADGASERFRAGTVKIAIDGVIENFTAALSRPYLDDAGRPTTNLGLSHFTPEKLTEIVTAADAAGFQLHFHALGDRAVQETLDALSAAAEVNGRRDSRHQLAHLQIVDPADAGRFAELGAIANLQPLWAQNEPQMLELTLPFIDPTLAARQYPFADLAGAGARFAVGSDWPVSNASPLAGMQVAVTRISEEPDELAAPFLLDQALPLVTIWDAYTAGSAYASFRDTQTGSIAPGMAADFVVLDRDPFLGPGEEIAAATVESTWVDGHRVFDRSGSAA